MDQQFKSLNVTLDKWMVEWVEQMGIPLDVFLRLALGTYIALIKEERE